MSNIIISPQSGIIEFNTGIAGSDSLMTSTAPIRLDATGGNSFITGSNFGIGTNNPQFTLDVDGSIHGTSGNFSTAITVGGNPVMTGVSPESDTLQTVTARGATSNQAISVSNSVTSNEFVVGNQGKVNSSSTVGLQLQSTSTNKPIIFLTNVAGQTERMRIQGDGKVGIGETAPEVKLEVAGDIMAKDSFVSAGATASQGYTFHDFGTGWGYKGVQSPSRLAMFTASAERVTIDADGKVGIGTTSPSQLLTLEGSSAAIKVSESGGAELRMAAGGSLGYVGTYNSNDLAILAGAGEKIRVKTDGKVGIGTVSPDSKLSVTSSTINSEDILYLKSGADSVNDYLGIAWEIGAGGNGPHSAIRSFAGPSGSDARLGFLTTSNGGTTLTEGLSVAHNGNVGIGTTSPAKTLDIVGEIRTSGRATFNEYVNTSLVFGTTDFTLGYAGGTSGIFIKGSTALAGNVGINTTAPQAKLHIAENDNGGNAEIILENSFNNTGSSTDETTQIQGRFGGFDGSYIITGKEGDYTTAALRKSFLSFSTRTATTGMGEKMRITSTGNVGIGTTNPSQKLHVVGNTTTTGVSYTDIVQTYSGSSIDFRHQDASVVVRVDTANARVGIGTTTPNEKLEVNGSVRVGNVKIQNANGGRIGLNRNTSTGAIYNNTFGGFQIQNNSATGFEIQSYNTSGVYTGVISIKQSNGNVGINTTDAGTKLEVDQSANTYSSGFSLRNAANVIYGLYVDGSNNLNFHYQGSPKVVFESGGDVLPATNEGSDLGSSSKRFASIFCSGLSASGSVTTSNIQLQSNLKILNKAQTSYLDLAARDTSGSEVVYNLSNIGSANFTGQIAAPAAVLSTTSTSDYVLRLLDTGVVGYDWSFPDTGTLKLGVNTTSTKTLKLINAGSGSFNLEADGATFAGNILLNGYLSVEGATGNTGSASDRWIGGDGTTGTWYYNVPTGSSHLFGINNSNVLTLNGAGATFAGAVTIANLSVSQTAPTTQLLFDNNNIDDGGGYNIDFKSSSNDTANRFMARIQALRGSGAISSLGFFTESGSALTRALLLDSSQNATFAGDLTARVGSFKSIDASASTLMNLMCNDGTNAATFRTTVSGRVFEIRSQNSGTLKFDSTSSAFTGNVTVGSGAAITFTVPSSGGNFININHTGNEAWTIGAQSGSGADDYLDIGISGGTRAMSWHETGRVGIGTTSPAVKLEVKSGGADDGFYLQRSNNTNPIVGLVQTGTGDGALLLRNASNVQTVILRGQGNSSITGGNVGIGTTSPSAKLHVYLPNQTLGFDSSMFVSANPSDYTVGRGSGITFKNADVYTGGVYGIREANNWTGALAFYTHTSSANNTFGSTFTEKMRITSAGNVGIGTTSPFTNLEVAGSGADSIIRLYAGGGTANIRTWEMRAVGVAGEGLLFRQVNDANNSYTNRMIIDTNGDVGIGTINPAARLDVKAGHIRLDAGYSLQWDNSHERIEQSDANLEFFVNNGQKVTINSDGIDVNGLTTANAFRSDANNTDYSLLTRNSANNAVIYVQSVNTNTNQPIAFFSYGSATAALGSKVLVVGKDKSYFDNTNLGIGTTSPAGKLDVRGGMSVFETTLTNNDDWQNSAISILERDIVGTGQSADKYSPNLNFHWTSRVSNSLWMNTSGYLNWGSYSGAGIPAADGVFQTNTINLIGTGRITGVDTVTASTDAANKAYVDAQVGSADTLQEVTNNGNTTTNSITMTNSLTIDGQGSSTDVLKLKGSARIQIENASATDSFYISNTGGSGASKLDLGGAVSIIEGGNVGIGLANPSDYASISADNLVVKGSGDTGITIATSNTAKESNLFFSDGSGASSYRGGVMYKHVDDTMRFLVAGAEKVQFNSSGNVGIGITDPDQKLDVNGNIRIPNQGKIVFGSAGTATDYLQLHDVVAGNPLLKLVQDNVERFSIEGVTGNVYMQGNVGIGTTSPSSQLTITKDSTSTYTSSDAGTATGDLVLQNDNQTSNNFNRISFQTPSANSGGNILDAARITAIYSNHGGANPSAHLSFETKEDAGTMYERVRITSDGNVGIGTTSPFKKLDLGATTSDTDIALNYSDVGTNLGQIGFALGSNKLISGDSDGDLVLRNSVSGKSIIFGTQSTERVRINSTGKVGVGITNPAKELDVVGTVRACVDAGGDQHQLRPTMLISYGTDAIINAESSGDDVRLNTQSNTVLIAKAEGNVGIGTAGPTAKLDIVGDGADIFLQSADYKIARIQPRGTGANLDKGLFSLFDGSTEDVRIDTAGNSWFNGGNVGIGTGSPSQKLDVNGTAIFGAAATRLTTYSDSGYAGIYNGSSLGSDESIYMGGGGIFFIANNAERMRINSSGYVGIGITNPAYKLDVAGNTRIGSSSQTTTSLYLTATNTAGSPAIAVQTIMQGYEGRGLGTFYTDTSYSGEEWFNGINYAGGFHRWSVGYDESGGQAEYLANAKFTVFHDGRVGIGTDAPSSLLHIADSGSDVKFTLDRTDARTYSIYTNSTSDLRIKDEDAGADRITIKSDGKVGINTGGSSLFNSFTVQGNANISNGDGAFLTFNNGDANITAHYNNANSVVGRDLSFKTYKAGVGNTEKMRITRDGNVGIGFASPNAKLEIHQAQVTTQFDRDCFLRLHPTATTNTSGFTNIMFGTSTTNNYGVAIGGFRAGTDDTPSFSIRMLNDSITGTEVLRILNSGNVGIGTNSPKAKLHIEGDKSYSLGYLDATSDLHIGNDTMSSAVGAYAGSISFGSTNESNLQAASIVAIQTDTDPNEIGLAFFTQHSQFGSTNLVESMRISNDGKVGIGTNNPIANLHVNGDVQIGSSANPNSFGALQVNQASNVDEAGIGILSASAGRSIRIWVDETRSYINSGNGGSGILVLNEGAGNVGIGTTNPTARITLADHTTAAGGIKFRTAASSVSLWSSGSGNLNTDKSFNVGSRLRLVGGNAVADPDIGFSGATAGTGFSRAGQDITFVSGGAEQMRLDNDGNLGIGTADPNRLLQINGGHGTTRMRLFYAGSQNDRNAYIDMWASEPGVTYNGSGMGSNINGSPYYGRYVTELGQSYIRFIAGALQLWTGPASSGTASTALQRLTILDGGNVGIGIGNPAYKLHVAGTVGLTNQLYFTAATADIQIGSSWGNGVLNFKNGSTTAITFDVPNNRIQNNLGKYLTSSSGTGQFGTLDNQSVAIVANNSTKMTILSGGNVGIGTANPAYKLDVAGSARIEGDLDLGAGFKIANYSGSYWQRIRTEDASASTTNAFNFETRNGSGSFIDHMVIRNDGNVGIGVTNPSYALQVGGSIVGTSKNFIIDHPTKEGKKLLHGCIEGPEAAVYFRGKSTSNIIEMPDYWIGLVDIDTMTVDITPWGPNQDIYVESIADDGEVTIAANTEEPLNYFYVVYGERKDIDKLEIEVIDPKYANENTD